MLLIIIRIIYAVVCAGAIATYLSTESLAAAVPIVAEHELIAFFVLLLISQSVTFLDIVIRKKHIEVVSAIYFGLMIGWLLSLLLIQAVEPVLNESYRGGVVLLTTLILPYLCISFLLQTKDDFRFVIPYVEFSREIKGATPLILDSSALIDGRIAEVVDTNIIDAPMVVPQFVLHEVQDIADSSDKMRRTRGRRGLEVLAKLQGNPLAEIKVHETRKDEFRGLTVDQKLVELAKQLGGRVVTNDFNLNKVASVQGISVVNLNDIANALKPRYIPGERITIKILKEGETAGQGVGYLDDGTMVVCEQASHLTGQVVDVIVTSVLQSSAGRMIFGRQVHSSGQ